MFEELKKYSMKRYVYVLENENKLIKIGITNNPYNRINSIQNASGVLITKYHISNPLRNNDVIEEKMLNVYKDKRTFGEWLKHCNFEEVVNKLNDIIDNYGIETSKNNLIDCEWGYNLDNGSISDWSTFDLVNILTPLVCEIEDEIFKTNIIEALDRSFYNLEIYKSKNDWLMRGFAINGIKACIRSILKYHGVNELLQHDNDAISFYKTTIGLMKFEDAKVLGVKLRKF